MVCKLEDIRIYQISLSLVGEISSFVSKSPLNKDFFLVDQIRRAAISIVINIAEGYGRHTRKDFAQFLSIALGSTNEVVALLDVINVVYKNLSVNILKDQYQQLSKQIYAFRSSLSK